MQVDFTKLNTMRRNKTMTAKAAKQSITGILVNEPIKSGKAAYNSSQINA